MECSMKRPRLRALIVSLALAASLAAAARPASSAPRPTAGCEQIALRVGSGAEEGSRVLLESVWIPDERRTSRAALRRHGEPWSYFRRTRLLVRGGSSPVTVTVPESWRHRVAISWGGTPAVSSLQIASCGASASRPWNAYAGGFYLRSRADCVPLDVRVGGRSTTVRLGVGRACGANRG
jgi:hypothetical protein